MKKSTFLLIILFATTIANGQKTENLQSKIKELQASFSRYTLQTEHFSRTITPYKFDIQKNGQLKNALALQKLDSVIYQEYEEEADTWHNDTKDEYLYNSELQNTAWIEKDWNFTTNTWQDTAKIELEFNNEGQVSAMNIFTIDEISGGFIQEMRTEAFYSPEGRLDSVLHFYEESENTWVKEGSQIYHYNETGQLVQMDYTSLEEDDDEEYLESLRFVYTYNDEGQMATSSMYFLDSEMEILFSETEYIYDTSGRLTATEFSSLSFVTFTVELNSRNAYEYNAAGDVSVETFSWWDSATSEWMTEEKYEYTYNNTNYSEVLFPSYLQFFGFNEDMYTFNKAITEIITFYNMAGEWVPFERSLYFYSEATPTNTTDIAQTLVSIYPNPATDNVTLGWDNHGLLSLEVYNITGAKVFEKQVSSGMTVPVSTLENGVYLFKLIDKSETIYSGKLIKR